MLQQRVVVRGLGCDRGGVGLDSVQAAYDVAVLRLQADLVGLHMSAVARPEVRVDFTEPEFPYGFIAATGPRCFNGLPLIEDVEEATVALASLFQGDVLELLGGRPWPECSGHGHPAEAALVELLAVWRCPVTGRTVARIGAFSG